MDFLSNNMDNAKKDSNRVSTLLAVSSLDGITPVILWAHPSTHAILTEGVATAEGSNTQVQFNDGGVFGGDAGLTYDKTTDILTTGGIKSNSDFLLSNFQSIEFYSDNFLTLLAYIYGATTNVVGLSGGGSAEADLDYSGLSAVRKDRKSVV